MMSLVLASGLTLVSAVAGPSAKPSWSCAYVAERLPRALNLLGDDAVPGEEARAARTRASLGEGALTRASNLALANRLGATRLVVVRCLDGETNTTLEAQSFRVDQPVSGDVVRAVRPRLELSAAIDDIARRLTTDTPSTHPPSSPFRAPSPEALSKAGLALERDDASERARGLVEALAADPTSIDLHLSAVEALIAARDFETAIRVAGAAPAKDSPQPLIRMLRFKRGVAQLEAGRYAEAADTFEALQAAGESAAVLNNLGIARFRVRDFAASGLFERAMRLVDHRPGDLSFNRSLTLIFEDKADGALEALDASIKADPSDVRTRLLRVWALKRLGRETERGEEWDLLLTMAPSFSSLGAPDLSRRLERVFLYERRPG